ncbi:MAG: hypothetical protein FWB83_02345 [Treponema sp.]|nr:hypothetical protein [Treponema sp.]
MPWRLIFSIIIFALFLVFITLNLENSCNISFGFTAIENVPVFITIFVSFAMGLICVLPLVLYIRIKRKEKKVKEIDPEPDAPYMDIPPADENIKKDAASARERFFAKRNDKKK